MIDKTSDMRLKNCPFCGGEAEFATKDGNWIWCKKCGAESNYFEQTEEAIKAWNTRKPLERIKERIIDATDNLTGTGVFGVETEFILEILKEEGGLNG